MTQKEKNEPKNERISKISKIQKLVSRCGEWYRCSLKIHFKLQNQTNGATRKQNVFLNVFFFNNKSQADFLFSQILLQNFSPSCLDYFCMQQIIFSVQQTSSHWLLQWMPYFLFLMALHKLLLTALKSSQAKLNSPLALCTSSLNFFSLSSSRHFFALLSCIFFSFASFLVFSASFCWLRLAPATSSYLLIVHVLYVLYVLHKFQCTNFMDPSTTSCRFFIC